MKDLAQDMEMDFSFSLSKGKAKVVHIDDEGSVETVIGVCLKLQQMDL